MTNQIKVALILENIRSTHNVGSIFRSADCFGISQIYLVGYTPSPVHDKDDRLPHISAKLDRQISKTALGAHKTVPFSVLKDIKSAVTKARGDGYSIGVLEQSSKSVLLDEFSPSKNLALVLGNEVDGVDQWTLSISDVILEIEQHGLKESLNVANAASVAMYALTTK